MQLPSLKKSSATVRNRLFTVRNCTWLPSTVRNRLSRLAPATPTVHNRPDRPTSAPSAAFTMIELLITLAIIGFLAILFLTLWRNQLAKAHDAQRKSDLERLKVAFEDYYNDAECYPPGDILEACRGTQLQPYLNRVPCDPFTDEPYCYVHDPDNASCGQSFRILASFENSFDKIIEKLGCQIEGIYCGWEEECGSLGDITTNYNYGVANSGSALYNPDAPSVPEEPSPPEDPTEGEAGYYGGGYACDPNGECNSNSDPVGKGCPTTFDDQYCGGDIGSPNGNCVGHSEYWCTQF